MLCRKAYADRSKRLLDEKFILPILTLIVAGTAANTTFHMRKAQAAPVKEHKVAICHGTASAKNPYVLIIVDQSAKATHLAGHGKNSAPDFALAGGRILTPQDEKYYRSLSNQSACGSGGSS